MHVMTLRGGLLETVHPVSAVAVQGERRIFAVGEAASSTWRSAGKPFQLHTSLLALGEDLEFTAEELAIGTSSHSGQPFHLALVRGLLARFDLTEALLQCGAEPPAHKPTWEALVAAGAPCLAVHNDCSGKHSFMLGACKAQGWPTEGYLAPDHPLQQRMIAAVARVTGEAPALAVDGCGVPTFWISVEGMARAWASLAEATADPSVDPVLGRIGAAMVAHPRLTSGDERIDLAIARRAQEPLIGKIGAQGVYNLALPGRGIGIALKVHSGDEAALATAVPAILDVVAPGALTPDPTWPWAIVRNVVGRVVGRRLIGGLSSSRSP